MEVDKKYIYMIVAVAVAAFAGFAAGKFNTTTEVVEKIQTVEVEKEVVKTVEVIVEKKIYLKSQAVDTQRTVIVEIKPDGTKIETTTELDRTKTTESNKEDTTVATDTSTDKQSSTEKQSEVVTKSASNYRVSVDLGLGSPLSRFDPRIVIGVHGDFRVTGPFWMGVWVQTDIPFMPPTNNIPDAIRGGLNLGVEF